MASTVIEAIDLARSFADEVEALFEMDFATLRIGQDQIRRRELRRRLGRDFGSRFCHLCLIAIVERQSKRIAERGECPLGGVGLGRFERDIMRKLGLRRAPEAGADPFPHRHRLPSPHGDANFGGIKAQGLAMLRVRPVTLGRQRLSIPTVKAEDAVGLGNRMPAFDDKCKRHSIYGP